MVGRTFRSIWLAELIKQSTCIYVVNIAKGKDILPITRRYHIIPSLTSVQNGLITNFGDVISNLSNIGDCVKNSKVFVSYFVKIG